MIFSFRSCITSLSLVALGATLACGEDAETTDRTDRTARQDLRPNDAPRSPDALRPWRHHSHGNKGSYDHPLVTYWDGRGWHPRGTTIDPRNHKAWEGGIAVDYNCYSQEITGGPNAAGTPYSRSDMEQAIEHWSSASGHATHFYNDWRDIKSDGSEDGIQILPMLLTGSPRRGSPTPECDDNGDGSHDQGQALFAIALPPNYDVNRTTRYPVLFLTPGHGSTHLKLVTSASHGSIDTLASLMSESSENDGRGLIVVIGNAGGQGSIGTNTEYATAINSLMRILRTRGNADTEKVVTWGSSRGGTNALFHASRKRRNYTVVGAFAGAPVVAAGITARLKMNFVPSIQGNYQASLCFLDPDCQNAWRWDHDPAPGTVPTHITQPLLGTSDPAEANDLGTLGNVDGFDPGAFVELCVAPRDFISGMGLGQHYYDRLPPSVTKRINNTFGAAHGLLGPLCTDHMRLFVLDRLANNSAYRDAFAQRVEPGEFHYRLTLDDDTPFDDSGDELEPLEMTGCGDKPPALLLPSIQQRTSDGSTEPSHFVLTGLAGRSFRVELTEAPSSDNVVHRWTGTLGDSEHSLPENCEYLATTDTLLCHFDEGLEQCRGDSPWGYDGTCGWRFHYDCDDDGTPEEIQNTYTPYVPQVAPELSVSPLQCKGAGWCMSPPDPDVLIPPAGGVPVAISPCLNFANNSCTP